MFVPDIRSRPLLNSRVTLGVCPTYLAHLVPTPDREKSPQRLAHGPASGGPRGPENRDAQPVWLSPPRWSLRAQSAGLNRPMRKTPGFAGVGKRASAMAPARPDRRRRVHSTASSKSCSGQGSQVIWARRARPVARRVAGTRWLRPPIKLFDPWIICFYVSLVGIPENGEPGRPSPAVRDWRRRPAPLMEGLPGKIPETLKPWAIIGLTRPRRFLTLAPACRP